MAPTHAWRSAVRGTEPAGSQPVPAVFHQPFGAEMQKLPLSGTTPSVTDTGTGPWKPRPGYMAMIEVIAEGPAYRAVEMEERTDDYRHRESVAVEGQVYLHREFKQHPNLDAYLKRHPFAVAEELFQGDDETSEWSVANADPDEWTLAVYLSASALVRSAQLAADTERGEDTSGEDVLREWQEVAESYDFATVNASWSEALDRLGADEEVAA